MSYIKVGQGKFRNPSRSTIEDHGSGSPVCAHPWLAAERRRMGETDRRAARSRPSGDHL